MKTTIVCGVLGAGKTTFIQNILQESTERTVVLVNDFGKTGIDGEILSADGIESVELPSGCVCCTLKFDLITTIEKVLKEFSPDHLYIEPSGVASPSGVLEALEALKISPVTVVGIVDATEFIESYESGMYGRFFEDQVMNSHIILVNKADLVDEETLTRTLQMVGRMNESAVVVPAVRAVLHEPIPEVEHKEIIRHAGGHHFHFESMALATNDAIAFDSLRKLFNDMAEGMYGRVIRAKALIHTDRGSCRFDLASGRVETVPFEDEIKEGRLVVIGKGLKEEGIRASIQPLSS